MEAIGAMRFVAKTSAAAEFNSCRILNVDGSAAAFGVTVSSTWPTIFQFHCRCPARGGKTLHPNRFFPLQRLSERLHTLHFRIKSGNSVSS